MELKNVLDEYGIVGVIGNYKNTINKDCLVKELNIKNIKDALKMVLLNDNILDKRISDLSISEYFKVELITKLNDELIIIGNISNSLIYKDKEYIKKLLIKLNNDYNKKIIIIDNDLNSFINCVKKICIVDNNIIKYSTDNYYDEELYKYVKIPKIVEFIKDVNKDNKKVDETLDIYELIKDIYRRLS